MAFECDVRGPGIWKLILSLTEGKKIEFTFKPKGIANFNIACEAQLQGWRVVGGHSDQAVVLSGRITAYKYPELMRRDVPYVNFEGPYDMKNNTGLFRVW
jgi:hypothetical protein